MRTPTADEAIGTTCKYIPFSIRLQSLHCSLLDWESESDINEEEDLIFSSSGPYNFWLDNKI